MPKGTNQKFKLYRLAQIMLEQTDEEHYITMPEILEALGRYEITADRKSIYDDIKILNEFGLAVENRRTKPSGRFSTRHCTTAILPLAPTATSTVNSEATTRTFEKANGSTIPYSRYGIPIVRSTRFIH